MPFVKLDCDVVHSSIWMERDLRSIFLTALVMARPYALDEPTPQLEVRELKETGWIVPAGEYGLVPSAGSGIIRMDGIDTDAGLEMLEKLGSPDPDSKDPEHGGRRVVRVDSGYIVLNFYKYRDRDYTAAERQRRHRERKKANHAPKTSDSDQQGVTGHGSNGVTVTQAEAEGEVETTVVVGARAGNSPQSNPQPPADVPLGSLAGESDADDPVRQGKDDTTRARELTMALNMGLRDNAALAGNFMPVVATSGTNLLAAQAIAEDGVHHAWAVRATYTLAKRFKPAKLGDSIGSLAWIAPRLKNPWQREAAKHAVAGATRPEEVPLDDSATGGANQRQGGLNGQAGAKGGEFDSGRLKGEGITIFARIRRSIAERDVYNDPSDPGQGGRKQRAIDPAVLAELSPAAQTALGAVGGALKVARMEEKDLSASDWKYAAAYAAAVQGGESTERPQHITQGTAP